jgi:hypothetical protein
MLSNYLGYQAIKIKNKFEKELRIYLKISIPFPIFPLPSMNIKLSR